MTSADRAAVPSADGGPRRERAWWIAVTAGAAAVLMFCYLRVAGTVPVLSDGAANALQAQDMLHGNLLLHGWRVTDVSFLTTELPQYALVIAAAGLRPEVAHIGAAITYTLLVLLAAWVARGRASGAEAVVRALIAAGIMLAPEPGAPTWVLLSDPDHVGTGVPPLLLLLLLLLIDRPRASRWVPVAAFVVLTWASVADPLAEAVGALPLAAVCLARVAAGRPRRLSALRTYWYELSLAAAAVLAALAATVVDDLIPTLGGYQTNKGVSGLIPLGEIPGNGPLVLRSVLALFGADFQDAARGRQHAVDLAFAAVHLAGLAFCWERRGVANVCNVPDVTKPVGKLHNGDHATVSTRRLRTARRHRACRGTGRPRHGRAACAGAEHSGQIPRDHPDPSAAQQHRAQPARSGRGLLARPAGRRDLARRHHQGD